MSRRFLVFTSAGDRSAIPLWLEGRRNFDLWVSYYGEQPGRHADVADRWQARRGGKFPNLHALYRENPDVFAGYDAVLVMDDDLIIDAPGLSRLFELREFAKLSILQPAFLRTGKISHPVTRFQAGRQLRYTDFIEMTCPLFRREDLEAFLAEYDGELCGWGTDHWFLDVIRRRPGFRAAVIDEIPCINPLDVAKGDTREIGRLRSDELRYRDWQDLARVRPIPLSDNRRVLESVPLASLEARLAVDRRRIKRRLQLRRYQKSLRAPSFERSADTVPLRTLFSPFSSLRPR